jgi:hypothetical protein
LAGADEPAAAWPTGCDDDFAATPSIAGAAPSLRGPAAAESVAGESAGGEFVAIAAATAWASALATTDVECCAGLISRANWGGLFASGGGADESWTAAA